MMADERAQIIGQAVARLDPLDRPSIERIAGMENGLWYLKEKINGAPDHKSVLDHTRPLKYAGLFDRADAQITFIREIPNQRTPDLIIEVGRYRFYLEVRKFELQITSSSYPVSKIVSAVTGKRGQLPDNEVGFVAIDNFDIELESVHEAMPYDHIEAALSELERLATENPAGWKKPSGVIIAASTSGGIGFSIPHFVWVNKQSEPPVSEELAGWIRSSFTDVDREIERQILQRKLG